MDSYEVNVTDHVLTGETFAGRPVYMKLVDIGALPNTTQKTVNTGISGANYFWIDPAYSMIFNSGASYPIPYTDPSNNKNSVTARLINSGASVIVQTGASWSGYSAYVAIKYTKK